MELDFYDELDKQEQENENNEYWEQQYDELQIKYDCLMEAFKIQKDILTSKNKTINKALELLDSYKLGKYDYALTCDGLLEFEDILKGENER